MRLNYVPCPESLPTPITPEFLPTPITQCQSLCVIKSIISELYSMIILQNKFICFQNDHFTKQIYLFSNQKIFGCYTSMIIYIQNSCVFCRQLILVSHHRLCTPKHFHGLSPLELCLTTNTGSFTQGGIYPYLLLPDTSFFLPFHVTMRLCWTLSNSTESTQSITKCSVDFQLCTHTHAM